MSLDLNLPEPPPRKGGRILPVATLLLALTAVLLLLAVLFRTPGRAASEAAAAPLDRDLAEVLEKRTLWREAAALWEEIGRTGEDLFRAGKCRLLAGEPERAARDLLAAEAAGLPEDLTAESSRLVIEAYAMMGKFTVRNEALERRTGGDAGEKAEVLARVGEEAIARAELQDAVRDEEVSRLLATSELTRDALDDAVAARNADPRRLLPTLSRLLSRRALTLEALGQGLGESPVLARRVREVRRELLANLLLENRLLRGARVSDADLEDHWKAHPDRYEDPEAVRFSRGATEEELTEVEGWHEKGAPYPDGLGPSAEADALLFALEPGEVADRPVRIADRDLLLRMDERRPARTVPFAEARERVRKDLLARRRSEALQALEEEVRARHPIEIVDEALKRVWEKMGAGGR